jgi:hypothetical protein
LQLTIELLFDHFNFVVAIICVNVFQHHTLVIPPLESICFGHTTVGLQESTNGSGIHAEVQRCIGSFRNFNFGNKWSLTAMEKATALPLRAGFMLNSPMPMLDVSDWLLLMTVSTTGGGRMLPLLVFSLPLCGGFSGLPWIPPRFMTSLRLPLMVVLVCKFVFVAFSDLQFHHF